PWMGSRASSGVRQERRAVRPFPGLGWHMSYFRRALMMPCKTLVAGFGNTLLGDDGFGVEVVSCLAASALPPEVETFDVGIGGMHFIARLLEGFEKVVVVDAVRGGQPPGTLYIFAFGTVETGVHDGERLEPHLAERVLVVGCEPQSCHPGLC